MVTLGVSMSSELDPEIEAMGKVQSALSQLDDEQRGRVIRWVADRFAIEVSAGRRGGSESKSMSTADMEQGSRVEEASDVEDPNQVTQRHFEHFAELYDSADPDTNADRMLVAAYWSQFVEGNASFYSVGLNKLLKDLGHGVTHVSTVMESLITQKPALILQLKKSGKSRQARKLYKVTDAGRKAVEQMIANHGG